YRSNSGARLGFCSVSTSKFRRTVWPSGRTYATAEEFVLVHPRRPPIKGEGLLRRRLQSACHSRTIRHRTDGCRVVALPRPPPDRRTMRKDGQIAHHH